MSTEPTSPRDQIPEIPEPEELMVTLSVKRPLLNDLRSPETSIKFENIFENPPDGAAAEEISYDKPVLDVSVDFRAHESVSDALQFVNVPGMSTDEPPVPLPAENKVVLMAAEDKPAEGVEAAPATDPAAPAYKPVLIVAREGKLQKLCPEEGKDAVVVFSNDPLIPDVLPTPDVASIFCVRGGNLGWAALNPAANPEQ